MFKNYKFYTVFLALFSAFFVYHIYKYQSYLNTRNETAIQQGIDKRNEIRDVLNDALENIEKDAEEFSQNLSKYNYSKTQLEALIRKNAKGNSFISGITVAFKPAYSKDSTKQLYAPFYSKKMSAIKYIEESYDYSVDSLNYAKWYTNTVKKQEANWSNPYLAEVAQELVVDYSVPFFKKDESGNKAIAGVLSYTVSSAHITSFLHEITLGKTGFAFIANSDLYVISHPKAEFLTSPEKAKEIVSQKPEFQALIDKNEGRFNSFSNIAQENAEYFFHKLSNEWILTIVIPKQDLLDSSYDIKKRLILISVFLSLVLIVLLIIAFKVWNGNTKNLWRFSFSVSFILLINIGFIWYLNVKDSYYFDKTNSTKILSTAAIDNYLVKHKKDLKKNGVSSEPIEIPTGIFLYDIDFKNAYDVAVIGKIWQKIPVSLDIKDKTTFVFPQASATGISVRVRPMSKERVGDYWLCSYDFNATIQFDFDYLKFPLNYKNLDLQITYPHLKDNVVLIPDIQAYEFISPSLKPGISSDIYMPNSRVKESYFSFHEHNFYSNLGFKDYKGYKNSPVLTFNVLIKTVIISSIISNIVPLFIIAIMVFLLPFTVDKIDGEVKEGASLTLIQAAGGFFFVLLLSHIQLRNNIETPGLIYLEVFYFVMYFMLAIMSAAVLLFLKTNDYPILEYKHNLIFKISYWPILLVSIFIVTFFIFY